MRREEKTLHPIHPNLTAANKHPVPPSAAAAAARREGACMHSVGGMDMGRSRLQGYMVHVCR